MTAPSAEQAYLFTHAVYREAAYQLHLPSERQALHALAVAILESVHAANLSAVAEELAGHARACGDTALEARFLLLAVETARRRATQQSGLRCADRLLELNLLSGPDRLNVLSDRQRMLADLGRPQQTLQALNDLIAQAEQLGDTRALVESLCTASRYEVMAGRHAESAAHLERARQLADLDGGPALRALVLDAQATIADHTGEFDRAKELFTASARLYAEAGRESSMLQARGNLATVLAASGRRPEALKILQELIPRFETLNDPRAAAVARSNVAKQLLMLGLHEDAEREFLAALEAHRGNGVRRSEAFALANLADVWRHLGKLDQAEQAVLQAVEIAREVGQPVYSAAYLATHAGLLLLTGREREAQQRLEESRAEFEAGGGRRYIPEYCDIWRLRVAASQACTGGGTPRGTSRLAAGPVAPRWVRAAELILQGMESAAGSTNDLALAIEAGRRVVAELRTAEREKQPALLWRGHLPSELSPPLRRALLARMEKRQGTGLEALRRLHPALVAALESG